MHIASATKLTHAKPAAKRRARTGEAGAAVALASPGAFGFVTDSVTSSDIGGYNQLLGSQRHRLAHLSVAVRIGLKMPQIRSRKRKCHVSAPYANSHIPATTIPPAQHA
jgi:hypothetical protein